VSAFGAGGLLVPGHPSSQSPLLPAGGGGAVRMERAALVELHDRGHRHYRRCFKVPLSGSVVPLQPHTAIEKLRIVTSRFGTGRQKMVLERWTNPKVSRRVCTCEYGLQSCLRKSAGVAKRPRERPPTRNPSRYDSQLFCIAVSPAVLWDMPPAAATLPQLHSLAEGVCRRTICLAGAASPAHAAPLAPLALAPRGRHERAVRDGARDGRAVPAAE
jgi:hypothetical protein